MKKLFLFVALSLASSVCFATANIAIDTATTSGNANNASSLTWAHVTTDGGCRGRLILVVGFNITGGPTVSGITYNGVSLTKSKATLYDSGSSEVSLWYLVNPALGSNSVVATFSGGGAFGEGGSISLTGVDQSTPVDVSTSTTGSSQTPSLSITTVADNTWAIDVAGQDQGTDTLSVTGSNVQRWNRGSTTSGGGGSTIGPITPAGSATFTWHLVLSAAWGQAITSFLPASTCAARTSDFFQVL